MSGLVPVIGSVAASVAASVAGPVAGTVVVFALLAAPPVTTAPASTPTPPAPAAVLVGDRGPVGDSRALALLAGAAKAAHLTPYQGVQFVSRWSQDETTSLLVDVRHLPGEGTIMRVRGTSTRAGGEMFAASANTDLPSGLSAAGAGPVDLLARNYSVVVAGTGSVAGRGTQVVESRRGDGSVAGRFWLDQQTSLILRREVFDSQGATVRASGFLDVSFDEPPFASHIPPMLPIPWRTRVAHTDLDQLRSAGWRCPDGLPAALELYDVRRGDDETGTVVHASYSDGLSLVSLFEQKGRLDARSLAGHRAERYGDGTIYVRDGVQQSVVWSAGGTVYTVLADAPQETVRAVVASLPHDYVKTGVVARLERGLQRVASWMNPFG